MKKRYSSLPLRTVLIAGLLLAVSGADAQYLRQNFSSSATVSNYVHASSPNTGQFTYIGNHANVGVSINSGRLRFQRNNTGAAGVCRNTGFGNPEVVVVQFDLLMSGNWQTDNDAITFQAGNGFSNNYTVEANAKVNAQFSINILSSWQLYQVRNITGNTVFATQFSGLRHFTWVINRSASAQTYMAPDGSSHSIGGQKADIWVNNAIVFNDVAVQNSSVPLQNFKMVYNSNHNTNIELDNFLIYPLKAATFPAGSYQIGLNGDYETFTNAGGLFQTLSNMGTVNGEYIFKIPASITTETGNNYVSGLTGTASSSFLIRPAGSSAVTVSSTTTPATGLLYFEGVKNVTIDGRGWDDNTTGADTQRKLTLRNNATAGPVIHFKNGSDNSTIRYCTVEGANTGAVHGVITYSPAASASYGDSYHQLIEWNHVKNAGTMPRYAFYMNGTSGAAYRNTTIENNRIYSFFQPGVDNGGLLIGNYNRSLAIRNNHFYQPNWLAMGSAQSYTAAISVGNIAATAEIDSVSITGNFIGGKSASCGGDKWTMQQSTENIPTRLHGIDLRIPPGSYGLIEDNTIDNLDLYFTRTSSTADCGFRGIVVGSGKVEVLNNTVGTSAKLMLRNTKKNTGGRIPVRGIDYNGSGRLISGNRVAGIKTNPSGNSNTHSFDITCIAVTASSDSLYVISNTIGSQSENENIYSEWHDASSLVRGIYSNTPSGKVCVIRNNQIGSLFNYSRQVTSYTAGVEATGSGRVIIENNLMYRLLGNGVGLYNSLRLVSGVLSATTGPYTAIRNNHIYDLKGENWGNHNSSVEGIYATASDTLLINGNRIYSLRNNSDRQNTTNPSAVVGIRIGNTLGAGCWIYNNMISLGKDHNGTVHEVPAPYIGIWNSAASASSKAYVYYNSVIIQGSTWASTMRGYALFKGTYTGAAQAGAFYVANNILINKRTGNVSNSAIGIENASSALTQSNNNVFFSGNAAHCGIRASTLYNFAGWKTATSKDQQSTLLDLTQPEASVCGTQTFVNLNTADLHLPGCEIRVHSAATPITSPIAVLHDFDGDFRKGPGPGADEVATTVFVWTGATSTDWNTASNWNVNQVPSCSDSVLIRSIGSVIATPAGHVTVQRNALLGVSGKGYFRSMYIGAGGQLSLGDEAVLEGCWQDGILAVEGSLISGHSQVKLAGSLALNGTYTSGTGTLVLNNDTVSPIPGNPVMNQIIKTYNESFVNMSMGGNAVPEFYHLEIANGGVFTLNAGMSKAMKINQGGTLNISANGKVVLNGHTLFLDGNIGNGTGEFMGDAQARLLIGGENALGHPLRFGANGQQLKTLRVNRGTIELSLGSPLLVTDTLSLLNGTIHTTNAHILELGVSAWSNTKKDHAVFINGPLRKQFNASGQTFEFPVGKGGKIRPVSVTAKENILTAFTVEYVNETAPEEYSPLQKNGYLSLVSDKEYWMIDRTPEQGGSKAQVKLTWDTVSGINPSQANLRRMRVVKWVSESGEWESMGPQDLDVYSDEQGGGWVQSAEISSFSPFTYGLSDDSDLPVELVSFSAEPEGREVVMKWVTVTEINNEHFQLQRSTDAKVFKDIGMVPGAGNSNRIINYDFTDYNAAGLGFEILYYRLKQVDYNGTFAYSDIIPVNIRPEGELVLVHAAFGSSSDVNMVFTAPAGGNGELRCFDSGGRLLMQRNIRVSQGVNNLNETVNGATSTGIYHLQLEMNGRMLMAKVPKAR